MQDRDRHVEVVRVHRLDATVGLAETRSSMQFSTYLTLFCMLRGTGPIFSAKVCQFTGVVSGPGYGSDGAARINATGTLAPRPLGPLASRRQENLDKA